MDREEIKRGLSFNKRISKQETRINPENQEKLPDLKI
jgi:hypothetical protein